MTRYSTYRSVDIPWIGEIPSNWILKKFKHLFDEKKSTRNPSLSSGSISFGKVIFKDDEKIPESTKESYQEVLNGEFLINPLNLNYDLKSLRIGLSRINVVVSQGYIVLQLRNDFVPEYFEYLLRKFDVEYMKSLGQGVRQTISFTHLKDEKLVVPPKSEQQLISRYLDKKTEQIDSLIEKIQKKIELLKEQRTSLLNQCVTKGLDPNVEMKDSDIEWIGEIPKHWNIVRLKYLSDINTGNKDTQDNVENGLFPFFVRSPKVERINSWSFDGESVLTSGDGAGVGKIFHYYNGKFDFHQRVYKFSKFRRILGHYFYWFLKENFQYEILRWNAKSTVDSVRLPFLQNFPMVVPPNEEQKTILEKIVLIDDRVEKMTSLLERKIILLKEYRQSLISSVVTGKVRVTEDMI